MFYQIFLSPQLKRWAIIAYKHGSYDLPQDLPNDVRLMTSDVCLFLRILRNLNRIFPGHPFCRKPPNGWFWVVKSSNLTHFNLSLPHFNSQSVK